MASRKRDFYLEGNDLLGKLRLNFLGTVLLSFVHLLGGDSEEQAIPRVKAKGIFLVNDHCIRQVANHPTTHAFEVPSGDLGTCLAGISAFKLQLDV